MTGANRSGLRLGLLLAAGLGWAAPVAGQSWVADAQVVERPESPTVGIALVVDGGSALDRPGREGETWIFAQALAESLNLGAPTTRARQAQVEVMPDRWSITVLTEPEDASALLRDLRAAISRAPSASIVAALKARLSASFLFESGSPVRQMEHERRALIDGFESAWARPPRGTAITVESLGASELEAIGRALTPARMHLAVVGPVVRSEVMAVIGLSGAPPASAAPADSTAGAPAVAEPEPSLPSGPFQGSVIWATGDRVRVVREVTNTWITAAFPIPADMPQTLLEFLAHRMSEEISTDPPDPGIFDAEVKILRRPGGRLLVVDAAVLPEAADRWEARILGTADVAAEPVQEAFFHWLRRRFRASALLRESAPEALASRLATDLLMAIRPDRRIAEEAWQLSPDLLLDAAQALGAPRILVYGPDFGAGSGR